ncbi:MAG: hypothetical protein ABSH36_01065 [Solirubrobacteraceae bacterium]
MGLLDDVIREHLELRRRHGADPGEVMSKEHEALGPAVVRAANETPADAGDDTLFASGHSTAPQRSAARGDVTAEDRRPEPRAGGRISADNAYLSEETVELDMRAVLAEDVDVGVAQAARGGMRSMTSAAPVRALH